MKSPKKSVEIVFPRGEKAIPTGLMKKLNKIVQVAFLSDS